MQSAPDCQHGYPEASGCQECFQLSDVEAAIASTFDLDALARQSQNYRQTATPTQPKKLLYTADELLTFGDDFASGLPYLPLLGEEGYIVKGWTTLISANPKAGKSELIIRSAADWPPTLFLSEEPLAILGQRRALFEQQEPPVPFPTNSAFVPALGIAPEVLLELATLKDFPVVVVDSTQLLGTTDSWKDSVVSPMLHKWIAICREHDKTLILIHHDRKGGGQHGESVSGSFAWLAAVDTLLLLKFVRGNERARDVSCISRIFASPDLRYKLTEGGHLEVLPDASPPVDADILAALRLGPRTVDGLVEITGHPRTTINRALTRLVRGGQVAVSLEADRGNRTPAIYAVAALGAK